MKSKERKFENLKNMLNRLSSETFFVCKVDGTTLGFESAMEHNFKCPEDGELLVQKDSNLEIERLKREIEKLHVDIVSGLEIDEKLMGIRKKKVKTVAKEKKKSSLKKTSEKEKPKAKESSLLKSSQKKRKVKLKIKHIKKKVKKHKRKR
jgi:hypothetical protein